METSLIPKPSADLTETSKLRPSIVSHVNQEGNFNTNVEFAQEFVANLNLITNGDSSTVDPLLDAGLSREYCNIFVVKDESYVGDSFLVPKTKALTHVSSVKIDPFDDAIKKYPALFITANGAYQRPAKPNQTFYYGMVLGVTPQGKFIKVRFRRLFGKELLQAALNGIDGAAAVSIGINEKDSGVDLLDQTNWLVKKIDIRKALIDHGIDYT